MNSCLFCQSDGPFSTVEHIIPESMGNDDLLLTGEVCDKCQNYFGKEVERFVLSQTPLGAWRTLMNIQSKKGKTPQVYFSQPKKEAEIYPAIHPRNDNVRLESAGTGRVYIDSKNPYLLEDLRNRNKQQIQVALTPKIFHMIGRFLCKVGVELVCSSDPAKAREDDLAQARDYARFGKLGDLWPIFHFSSGLVSDFSRVSEDRETEEVSC